MLNYGHLGNGLVVWDNERNNENNSDYLSLAHIDTFRVIYLYRVVTDKELDYIFRVATRTNPSVSITQTEQKVFRQHSSKLTDIVIQNHKVKIKGKYIPQTYTIPLL